MTPTFFSSLWSSERRYYHNLRSNVDEEGYYSFHDEENALGAPSTIENSQVPKIDAKCSLHSYPPNVLHRDLGCDGDNGMTVGLVHHHKHCQNIAKRGTRPWTGAHTLGFALSKMFSFVTPFDLCVFHYQNLFAMLHHPLSSSKAIQRTQLDHLKRSWRHLAVTLLLTTTTILIIIPVLVSAAVLVYGGMPPSYSNARLRERMLPQHQWDRDVRSRIGGLVKGGMKFGDVNLDGIEILTTEMYGEERYLRFPDHLWGHGLNNVLQEALLYGLLAHHSNRSYVFEDFVWSHLPLPYTLYDFTLRPTRVPMSAFLGGWIVGQNKHREYHDPQLQLQEVERQISEDSQTREKEKHRPYGPLFVRRVRDLSKWARAQFVFRVQPQRRRPQQQGGQRRKTTTGFFLDNGSGSSSVHESRRGDANRGLASALVPPGSKTRTVPPRKTRSSISANYFEHVCPPSRRVEIFYTWPSNVSSGHADFNVVTRDGAPDATADGIDILHWWLERLDREDVRDERCVVVRERERRVWDSEFFGTRRPLSLFPILRASPVLRAFAWSDLVKNAVDRTIARFFSNHQHSLSLQIPWNLGTQPEGSGHLGSDIGAIMDNEEGSGRPAVIGLDTSAASEDISATPNLISADCIHAANCNHLNTIASSDGIITADDGSLQEDVDTQVISGVVAVHLRRGDYKRHCLRLANWGAGYMGWNRLVEAPSIGSGPGGAVRGAGGEEFGFEDGLRDCLARNGSSRVFASEDGPTSTIKSIDLSLAPSGELEKTEMKDEERRKLTETYYLAHCLPTIPQIVRRLREVRAESIRISSQTSSLDSLSTFGSTMTSSVTTDGNGLWSATVAASANDDHSYPSMLRKVYVLTNGWPSFVEELRGALLEDGWEKVVGSTDVERGEVPLQDSQATEAAHGDDERCEYGVHRQPYWPAGDLDMMIRSNGRVESSDCTGELGLSKEEKGVSAAIDMELAERAEVFIGNGFSSLSANIVMLRLARGLGVHTNRMF